MLINCIVQSLTVTLRRGSEWVHLYSLYGTVLCWHSDAIVAHMSVDLAVLRGCGYIQL